MFVIFTSTASKGHSSWLLRLIHWSGLWCGKYDNTHVNLVWSAGCSYYKIGRLFLKITFTVYVSYVEPCQPFPEYNRHNKGVLEIHAPHSALFAVHVTLLAKQRPSTRSRVRHWATGFRRSTRLLVFTQNPMPPFQFSWTGKGKSTCLCSSSSSVSVCAHPPGTALMSLSTQPILFCPLIRPFIYLFRKQQLQMSIGRIPRSNTKIFPTAFVNRHFPIEHRDSSRADSLMETKTR